MGILHKLAHLFNWQFGMPYSWYDRDTLMMGFKCSKCGDISGVHKPPIDEMIADAYANKEPDK